MNAGVTTDIDGDARMGVPDLGADEVVGPVEWHYLYLPIILRN